MKASKVVLPAIVLVTASADVSAAATSVRQANQFDVTIAQGTGGRPEIDPTSVTSPDGRHELRGDLDLSMIVRCKDPVDCTAVGVRLAFGSADTVESEPGVPAPTGILSRRFRSETFAGATNVRALLTLSGSTIGVIRFNNPGAAPDSSGDNGDPVDAPTINTMISRDCRPTIQHAVVNNRHTVYGQDRAVFIVSPNGNVALRPPALVDEDDEVNVIVVGDSVLLSAMKVRRTSAFGVGGFNLVGADQTLPQGITRKALTDELAVPCDTLRIALRDFQPGRAEVTMSALGEKNEVVTGTFDFGVNTLYSGALSLGVIRTQLRNPAFGLAYSGADSLVTEVEDGSPRVLYTLTYTPFVWGKRDLEKSTDFIDKTRLNPMFGLVLNDVTDNFVTGLSYDVASAVYLTGGVHAGRVRSLDRQSGLKVGDPFGGTREQIPTATEWDWDWFVGLSLDLRAAAQFFSKALSAAGS